jgi:hypothetical protein
MPAKPTCAVMVPTVRADLFATFLRTFSATPALAGWRLYPVIQGWSKEELARVQAMSEWGRVTQAVVQDEKEAPYVLRVRTMCLHEDVDVWCNCDDDMEFLPGETDYSEAVARVLEPHTGVVSANWIRSEGFRQRAVFKKGSFVGQAIVNMAGGQLYARKIVRLLAAQPLVPYMFDDVQVGLAAYVAGYDNYRYQGSLLIHRILMPGGLKVYFNTRTLPKPNPRLVTLRSSKKVYVVDNNYLMPVDDDLTPYARLLHDRNHARLH